MRMWMVDPQIMCRKHLLGEHVEIHMLVASMDKGRSIKGFLDKGLVEPYQVVSRHNQLVGEMLARGYSHRSPLVVSNNSSLFSITWARYVDPHKNLAELIRRCEDCHHLLDAQTARVNIAQ